jgi:CDP-diacylglycerol--serine O-phosphatidyltransferase
MSRMEKSPLRPKKLPLHKMIPNMITLTAMAAGMTSVRLAIAASAAAPGEAGHKWEMSVLFIVIAAFMDAFDGAAARLLKAQSKLGAELDSFSDCVCFGVAPALVLYLWRLQEMGKWGWPIALIFAMSVTLRLARFNIATEEKDPDDPLSKYFTGVPSPLGAGLCILPIIVSFQIDPHPVGIDAAADAVLRNPALIGLWTLVCAALMVSHIPTFSSKQLRIPYKMRIIALGGFCILLAALLNEPWPTLTLMGAVYLLSLPLGVQHYNRKERALHSGEKDEDDQEDD